MTASLGFGATTSPVAAALRARLAAPRSTAVRVYIPREVIAYTGRHNPPPEAGHVPKRRRPRLAVFVRLIPLIWLIRPCSCGAQVWPCRGTLHTIRARLGWTAWIDDALVDWAVKARALAAQQTATPTPRPRPRSRPRPRPRPHPRA